MRGMGKAWSSIAIVLVLGSLLSCAPGESEPPAGPGAGLPAKLSDSKDTQKLVSGQQQNVAALLCDTCMRLDQAGVTPANAAEKQVTQRFSTPRVRVDQTARLHVYVELTTVNDAVLQTLIPYGLEIEQVHEQWRIVQGWMPCEHLDGLTKLDTVRKIRPPQYAVAR